MRFYGYLYRLLLGAWIGAILFFAGIVAPALFRILDRDHAAAVVGEVLPRFNTFALAAGIALMVVSVFAEGARGRSLVRLLLFAGMSVLVAVSIFVIIPQMDAIRTEAGEPISALVPEHPLRTDFGRLHAIAALLMLGQLALGAAALGIPIRGRPSPPAATNP